VTVAVKKKPGKTSPKGTGTKAVQATRTLNPLHFEDLEPRVS
jgi:hypothetical protein